MKSTLLACRPGVLATLFLLAAFTPPADAQEWHPAKNGPGNVSWHGEEDITVPAGQFHVFRCWYADIAPGVGPVRQILPGMEMEWAELVSFDVPVRTEPISLTNVKSLFR